MDEERFNQSVRKLLKEAGVTSQREIEKAVRDAQAAGRLPDAAVAATMTLRVEGLGITHVVDGRIDLS